MRLKGLKYASRYGAIALGVAVLAVFGAWMVLAKPFAVRIAEPEASIADVARHMVLPAGKPTVATVEDVDKLEDPTLKRLARNGDKVLVYADDQMVVLYRSSIDRLVSVSRAAIDPGIGQVKGTRVIIRNGTGKPATGRAFQEQLQRQYSGLASVRLEDAARSDYPSTVVLDLTEDNKQALVLSFIDTLHARHGVLPMGEQPPDNADILIIIGNDWKE